MFHRTAIYLGPLATEGEDAMVIGSICNHLPVGSFYIPEDLNLLLSRYPYSHSFEMCFYLLKMMLPKCNTESSLLVVSFDPRNTT
jgi:hypothetical protein